MSALPRFGKYVTTQLIGRGGMAEVYRARHPVLNRDVAIKVIYSLFASDPGFGDRFRREAQLVASLRHSHIVQLYDYDFAGDQPYMVMEFLSGGSLSERLESLKARGRTMSLVDAVLLMDDLSSALDYAHAHGAIHRDIKPANVMFTSMGEPVLTDFGIAKMLGSASSTSTVSGTAVGTPAYMSPEQASGKPVDARSDIYSLGIVLYELVTGRTPFEGQSITEIMLKHLTTPPPPPRQFNPGIPEGVEAVILRALAKAPAERFASAGDLAKALRVAMVGQQGLASSEVAVDVPTISKPPPAPLVEPPKPITPQPDRLAPPAPETNPGRPTAPIPQRSVAPRAPAPDQPSYPQTERIPTPVPGSQSSLAPGPVSVPPLPSKQAQSNRPLLAVAGILGGLVVLTLCGLVAFFVFRPPTTSGAKAEATAVSTNSAGSQVTAAPTVAPTAKSAPAPTRTAQTQPTAPRQPTAAPPPSGKAATLIVVNNFEEDQDFYVDGQFTTAVVTGSYAVLQTTEGKHALANCAHGKNPKDNPDNCGVDNTDVNENPYDWEIDGNAKPQGSVNFIVLNTSKSGANFFVDDQLVASPNSGKYAIIQIKPGNHKFQACPGGENPKDNAGDCGEKKTESIESANFTWTITD